MVKKRILVALVAAVALSSCSTMSAQEFYEKTYYSDYCFFDSASDEVTTQYWKQLCELSKTETK